MERLTESTPSITSFTRSDDNTVALTFAPADPLVAVEVIVDTPEPIPATDTRTDVALIDAAVQRLLLYRDDFQPAADAAVCSPHERHPLVMREVVPAMDTLPRNRAGIVLFHDALGHRGA